MSKGRRFECGHEECTLCAGEVPHGDQGVRDEALRQEGRQQEREAIVAWLDGFERDPSVEMRAFTRWVAEAIRCGEHLMQGLERGAHLAPKEGT